MGVRDRGWREVGRGGNVCTQCASPGYVDPDGDGGMGMGRWGGEGVGEVGVGVGVFEGEG